MTCHFLAVLGIAQISHGFITVVGAYEKAKQAVTIDGANALAGLRFEADFEVMTATSQASVGGCYKVFQCQKLSKYLPEPH